MKDVRINLLEGVSRLGKTSDDLETGNIACQVPNLTRFKGHRRRYRPLESQEQTYRRLGGGFDLPASDAEAAKRTETRAKVKRMAKIVKTKEGYRFVKKAEAEAESD